METVPPVYSQVAASVFGNGIDRIYEEFDEAEAYFYRRVGCNLRAATSSNSDKKRQINFSR